MNCQNWNWSWDIEEDDDDGPTTPWEAIKYGLTPKIKINDKKIN
tara:strand:- start:1810 stop:1941 length:132 start_codon:yes stop_codon:yes gene_type:complete